MKTVSEREILIDHISMITGKTDYELIEIEQVNNRFSGAKGIMDLKYGKKFDDSDPERISVKTLVNVGVCGGELKFYDNPFPGRKPLPGTTGKVAFVLADKEPLPVGALSGEKKGWNLEFLASHYGENNFKIVDPKWDKIVKQRYENILAKISETPKVHKFDRKYEVKGVGVPTEPGTMKIQVDHAGQEKLEAAMVVMQKRLDELIEENKKLSGGKKKLFDFSKDKKEEKPDNVVEVNASNFAG
jgi:hypothetical protein